MQTSRQRTGPVWVLLKPNGGALEAELLDGSALEVPRGFAVLCQVFPRRGLRLEAPRPARQSHRASRNRGSVTARPSEPKSRNDGSAPSLPPKRRSPTRRGPLLEACWVPGCGWPGGRSPAAIYSHVVRTHSKKAWRDRPSRAERAARRKRERTKVTRRVKTRVLTRRPPQRKRVRTPVPSPQRPPAPVVARPDPELPPPVREFCSLCRFTTADHRELLSHLAAHDGRPSPK